MKGFLFFFKLLKHSSLIVITTFIFSFFIRDYSSKHTIDFISGCVDVHLRVWICESVHGWVCTCVFSVDGGRQSHTFTYADMHIERASRFHFPNSLTWLWSVRDFSRRHLLNVPHNENESGTVWLVIYLLSIQPLLHLYIHFTMNAIIRVFGQLGSPLLY